MTKKCLVYLVSRGGHFDLLFIPIVFQTRGSISQWNSEPTAIYGATLAAILDNSPDTNYNHKLQSYPADHKLQFGVCQKEGKTSFTRKKNLK